MKLFCRSVIAAILFTALPLPVARSQPAGDGKELEATLRSLEKEIAAVRGLAFKNPVQARIIPRPAGDAKGIQGYYSPKEKTLYLYDDVKGSYKQGVLIHEMLHALQDQHFDLAKLKTQLHQERFGSDADLALAALVEGDATYTMIEVMKKDNAKVGAMLDVPLAQAKNLQNAFLYSQGARYVKTLKEKGGWTSVNFAYKFPPRNTASIFNLASVSGIDFGRGKTQGAYELFKMMSEHPATREQAELAAKSWRGDRSQTLGKGQVTLLAFSSKEVAALVYDALSKLKDDQLKGSARAEDLGRITWVAKDDSIHGLLLRGQRIVSASAKSPADFTALIDLVDGPPQTVVFDTKAKKKISFGDMAEKLLQADLICIGETHDSEPHHRVQLQVIKALFAFDERLGVGMEMFQKPYQKEIDRYLRGESDEAEFLEKTEYRKRWGFDWSLYRPIVEFCRHNKVPLAGLNVSRELTSRVSKLGYAGLNKDEQAELVLVNFQVKEHRDYWYERLSKMHGDSKATEEQKERSYQVMTVWDGYMGMTAGQFQRDRSLRRFVVLAGSGHIDRGFGIPQRAAGFTGGKTATIRIEYEGEAESTLADPVTDYVVIIK